ncbi:MAG: hypothetical protein K6L76_10655 [Agarilytica sp.]
MIIPPSTSFAFSNSTHNSNTLNGDARASTPIRAGQERANPTTTPPVQPANQNDVARQENNLRQVDDTNRSERSALDRSRQENSETSVQQNTQQRAAPQTTEPQLAEAQPAEASGDEAPIPPSQIEATQRNAPEAFEAEDEAIELRPLVVDQQQGATTQAFFTLNANDSRGSIIDTFV